MYRPVKAVLCMYATVIHKHGLLKTAEFSAVEFITLTKGFGKLWTYPVVNEIWNVSCSHYWFHMAL